MPTHGESLLRRAMEALEWANVYKMHFDALQAAITTNIAWSPIP